MAAWRYEISLLVLKKYFTHSLHSLVKYCSTLEEKFCISKRPCNILYKLNHDNTKLSTFPLNLNITTVTQFVWVLYDQEAMLKRPIGFRTPLKTSPPLIK